MFCSPRRTCCHWRVAGTPTAKTFIDTADLDGDSDVTDNNHGRYGFDAFTRSNGNTGTPINTASSSSIPAIGGAIGRIDQRYILFADSMTRMAMVTLRSVDLHQIVPVLLNMLSA